MAINFPNNPTNGQIYSEGNKSWQWLGNRWGTYNIQNPEAFAFRNKIINGGFDIWQRGTSFTGVGAGVFTADRWTTSSSTATLNKNISRQNMSASDLPFTEAGLVYCMRALYTSGTNTAELPICQPIELTRTGSPGPFKSGQIYTLSYYARCQSNNTIRWSLQFRDNSNTGTNASQGASELQAITTSWTRYSHTFTLHSPNITNTSLCVTFTNNITPANTYIDITGVQLEEGPTATPFEHRPIGTELALCERYYQGKRRFGSTGRSISNSSGLNNSVALISPTMRSIPSVTIYDPIAYNAGTYSYGAMILAGVTSEWVAFAAEINYQAWYFAASYNLNAEL